MFLINKALLAIDRDASLLKTFWCLFGLEFYRKTLYFLMFNLVAFSAINIINSKGTGIHLYLFYLFAYLLTMFHANILISIKAIPNCLPSQMRLNIFVFTAFVIAVAAMWFYIFAPKLLYSVLPVEYFHDLVPRLCLLTFVFISINMITNILATEFYISRSIKFHWAYEIMVTIVYAAALAIFLKVLMPTINQSGWYSVQKAEIIKLACVLVVVEVCKMMPLIPAYWKRLSYQNLKEYVTCKQLLVSVALILKLILAKSTLLIVIMFSIASLIDPNNHTFPNFVPLVLSLTIILVIFFIANIFERVTMNILYKYPAQGRWLLHVLFRCYCVLLVLFVGSVVIYLAYTPEIYVGAMFFVSGCAATVLASRYCLLTFELTQSIQSSSKSISDGMQMLIYCNILLWSVLLLGVEYLCVIKISILAPYHLECLTVLNLILFLFFYLYKKI